jgi:hypothetical protein
MRRLRLAIVLAGILATGVAAPVDARASITLNMRITPVGADCIFTYTASWSGLRPRVRTVELYILGPDGPTYLIHTEPAGRSGSFGFNIPLEGSGDTGGRVLFLDAGGRVLHTHDNEEGLVSFSC